MRGRRNFRGFTLIEIMLVIVILSILATLSMPLYSRIKIRANESAAVASVKTLINALEMYRAAQTPIIYPVNLADLSKPSANPPYINEILASSTSAENPKQGYYFTYSRDLNEPSSKYTLIASPSRPKATGERYFYTDESGVIYVSLSPPTRTDPGSPIE